MGAPENAPGVLVTGASTGIGRAVALHLDGMGYRVFAGVRTAQAADGLVSAASARLKPVDLDVTQGDQIGVVAEWIESQMGEGGLSGLVNNAGIAVGGPLEVVPVERLRLQFEVNVVGLIAVTQSVLPALRRGRGRIVNVGSVAGMLAYPFIGPYAGSKFALEAVTDAWRVELAPWGIPVALIQAGKIETPIWDKSAAAFQADLAAMPPAAQEHYGTAIPGILRLITGGRRAPASAVVDAVTHALTAPRPRSRYRVGRDAAVIRWLRYLPDGWRDRLIRANLPPYGPPGAASYTGPVT